MKGSLAWIIFTVAAISCLVWIGFGVRDDLHEDNVFHDIIEERIDIAESSGDTLHIGVVGDWASHADILDGVQLAADDINARGGVLGRKIDLTVENDKGSIDGALAAAQKFASAPQIAFVIGHTHPRLNTAVAQNYEFYGVLAMAPNTNTARSSTHAFSLLFENGMPPHQTGGAIINLAKRNKWQRLGLIYTKSGQAMRQARQFESMADKHNIKIPLAYAFEGRGSGISRHMTRWKRELALDAIVLAVDKADIVPITSACRAVGLDCPFVVLGEMPHELTAAERKHVGDIHSLAPPPIDADFTKRFKAKFKHAPPMDAVLGYDALATLVQSIEKTKSFIPSEVAKTLKNGPVVDSLSGTLRYNEQGAAIKKPPQFMQP